MRSTGLFICGALTLCTLACTDDGLSDDSQESEAGDSSSGDGDGDPGGDGDGDIPSGDGDGDTPTGDGDGGDPSGDGDGDPGETDDPPPCVYPEAAEPMALDEPIAAYAWPEAIAADGQTLPLDLELAHCDSDPIIDWSPHDILVFVSIPAW